LKKSYSKKRPGFFSQTTFPILVALYPLLLILDKFNETYFILLFLIVSALLLFLNLDIKDQTIDIEPSFINYSAIFYTFLGFSLLNSFKIGLLLLSIAFILFLFQIKKWLKKYNPGEFVTFIVNIYSELLLFLLAILFLISWLDKFIQSLKTSTSMSVNTLEKIENHYAIIILAIIIMSIFIKVLFEMLFQLTKIYFKHHNKKKDFKRIKIMKNLSLIGLILMILCAPHVVFGELYNFFATAYRLGEFSLWDRAYFSFCLQYAMPMDAEVPVFNIKRELNSIPMGRIIQFAHISTAKVIEITIFATIGNIFFETIKTNKSKE
jgi:hypothetical protein